MTRLTPRARALALTGMAAALTTFCGAAAAEPLALSDVPLFLSTDVVPNLIMAIDDSTSMDFEVLLRSNDGAAWWRTANSGGCTSGANSFAGCTANGTGDVLALGELNFNYAGNASGTWKKFVYLFPNGSDSNDNSYRRRAADATDDHFAVPPLPQFAWARSPTYNAMYFNPAQVYEPWESTVGTGSYSFADAVPTAAVFDPVFGAAAATPKLNLTQDVAGTVNVNPTDACGASPWQVQAQYYFRIFAGMTIPVGTCIRRAFGSQQNWERVTNTACVVGNNCTTSQGAATWTGQMSSNGSLAIRYFPATFYLPAATALPAGYGYIGTTLTGNAPDGSALLGYEIKSDNFQSPALYAAAMHNFANWFTYHRKRHLALRAGLGRAFRDITKMRVAGFTINQANVSSPPDVAMQDIAANRNTLYQQFYENWVRSGGTPNRAGVGNILRNFKRSGAGAPIQYACQKNFGMLFTDGFSNPPPSPLTDYIGVLGNVDGPAGAPYADGFSGSIADGAMAGYSSNLRPDLLPAGRVPMPADCKLAGHSDALDCNPNQHLNFYAITLNGHGLLFDPDHPVDPYATAPLWPTTFPQRHPSAVDDLWHATINTRGRMLTARNSEEIAQRLTDMLNNIVERTSSASSAAVNSGVISSSTRVYQARFNTSNWSGQLLAFGVDPQTGKVNANPEWDASNQLPVPDARRIFTVDETGSPVAFTTGTLSTQKQRELTGTAAGNPDPLPSTVGTYVNYIRGQDIAGFRERSSKLGDIVSSAPLYVGAPRARYSDNLESKPYSTFVNNRKNRDAIVYAGANDGMLHAFDAAGGRERFAFIPSSVFGNLPRLTELTYAHRYFVDGAPNSNDVFFKQADHWRTVLVGGLKKGGQGIYALDVTDPQQFNGAQSAPDKVFLWEFTDANDPDLGFTFSQPAIVRLHDGSWAAVFGNGYNNTAPDGAQSATGNAVLYVVDIEKGTIIRKFDTGVGTANDPSGAARPNGLATPVMVDTDGDRIVDHAYAGDLFGNLWKFDLRGDDQDDWDFAFHDASDKPQPLFVARDAASPSNVQPITVRPEVARGPHGAGVMVLFGTGQYLEGNDKLTTPTRVQTFYGLLDANSYTANDRIPSRAQLTKQEILAEPSVDPDGAGPQPATHARITSGEPLSGRGWYLDLKAPAPTGYQGEKQVTDPVVRGDRVIFTTLIPDPDPCNFGGRSWLMELDLLNGGRLKDSPLDVNGDDQVDGRDLVGDDVASGIEADEILSRPEILACLRDDCGPDRKLASGSSGGLFGKGESAPRGARGRQSWRQVR